MSTIVPIVFQISEEQKQVISKIAASVAPLLAPCDCVLLTLILRKDGAESAEGQTTKRQPTAPEKTESGETRDFHGCRSGLLAKCQSYYDVPSDLHRTTEDSALIWADKNLQAATRSSFVPN